MAAVCYHRTWYKNMDNFIYHFLYHIFSILLMNTDSFGQYVTISFLQPKAEFWFSDFWVVQGICLLDFFQTLKESHILGIKFQHWPLNILSIYIASCKDEIRMSHNLSFKVFIFFQSPVYGTLLILFAYLLEKEMHMNIWVS